MMSLFPWYRVAILNSLWLLQVFTCTESVFHSIFLIFLHDPFLVSAWLKAFGHHNNRSWYAQSVWNDSTVDTLPELLPLCCEIVVQEQNKAWFRLMCLDLWILSLQAWSYGPLLVSIEINYFLWSILSSMSVWCTLDRSQFDFVRECLKGHIRGIRYNPHSVPPFLEHRFSPKFFQGLVVCLHPSIFPIFGCAAQTNGQTG